MSYQERLNGARQSNNGRMVYFYIIMGLGIYLFICGLVLNVMWIIDLVMWL